MTPLPGLNDQTKPRNLHSIIPESVGIVGKMIHVIAVEPLTSRAISSTCSLNAFHRGLPAETRIAWSVVFSVGTFRRRNGFPTDRL